MNKKLEMGFMTMDGHKSLDVKLKHLIDYANANINNWDDPEEAVEWGKKTIEQGIKNIVSQGVAFLK